ncbi:unnamed protein product [Diatraea saccharalis]|uniref:Uncharacterized protein n=1 Tax=Diatraea saccharalis TaxID=40085 RepID=A0A9N9MZU6_9NEOP|nr:unnamed protein product [Diatraea saccharalis]
MRQGRQVATESNETYMENTYDLAIAKIAFQIQSSEKSRFDNLFIHFGSFHIMMAYFKAIGKFIDNCGITNVMINAQVLASASVNTFITGQHFNRCKRLHPLLSLALQSIHFEKFLNTKNMEVTDEIRQYLIQFKSEKSTDPEINNNKLIEILEKYERYQQRTLEGKHGKTAHSYMIYINLINYYFLLCKSIRKPDFELFKFIFPKINNIYLS